MDVQEEAGLPAAAEGRGETGHEVGRKNVVRARYFCTQQVWVKDEPRAATKMVISAPKAKPAAPKPKGLPKPKPAPKKLKKGQTLILVLREELMR